MKHGIAIAVLLFAAASSTAQQTVQPADGTLTLREAAERALGENPAIGGADARRGVAEARLLEAKSMWLPRVEATETVMRGDNPVFVFGSLLEQGRFGAEHFDPLFLNDPPAMSNFRLAVNVRFTLFDQLRRFNAVRQARNGVAQAALGGEEARQSIRFETISRFYGVILAREQQRIAEEAVRAAAADAAAMRDRFEQGLLVESDALSADVQLASFRQQAIVAGGNLAIAEAALATIIRRPLGESLGVSGSIPQREFAGIPIEDAIASGLESRGAVRIAHSVAENARIQSATAKGSFLPRVDSFASWGASGEKLTGGDPDKAIGLVVALDLFDGGKFARLAESRAAINAAESDEQMTRDRVTMEIVTAWHRTQAARERIAVAIGSVQQAEAATAIVRDRFENGLTTITEQLRAQTALLTAKLELLAANYDYITHYAELLRATGGLNDVETFS